MRIFDASHHVKARRRCREEQRRGNHGARHIFVDASRVPSFSHSLDVDDARALCVWENAAHLLRMHRDAGIRVLHVPLAYHPSMNFLTAQCERGQHCRWANAPARDIDVVWIGNTAQRRKAIIDAWRREVLEPPVVRLTNKSNPGASAPTTQTDVDVLGVPRSAAEARARCQ